MAYDVIALALLSAAAWGASSPLSKAGLERGGTPFQVAMTVVVVSVVTYWAALFATGTTLLLRPLWVVGLFAVTGLLATAVARVVLYAGVQRVGASVNSAVVNTRPVWSMTLAVLLLGEAVTAQNVLGIVVVVLGLVVLAFSKGGDISGWELRDLSFPLLGAIIFAVGNVARRFGLSATGMHPLEAVAINETAGLLGLLFVVVVWRGNDVREFLHAPRDAYAYFVGCGLVSSVALFTLFAALSRGRVVLVDPLSSPTSLFAILFTFLFLREVERVTWRLLVGAVLVVLGVVLITGPQVLTL